MPQEIKTPTDPPLLDVKVTNPITYIKRWWAKIIGNEGMEFRFRIRPLTAIAVSVVVVSLVLGLGRFVLPASIPFFKYNPTTGIEPRPTSTPEIWRETAYTGTLQYSTPTKRFYLVTTAAEAITLEIPENIDLATLVGKRIFASGTYNKSTRILKVSDAKNLEVLSKSPVPIPTVTPIPSVTPEAISSPETSSTATP